ncbi:hypothetical protein C1192_03210 [Escherichia marmotae]|nr:hypothetical protein C1192_03210 [Escherichia marmotae]
MLRLRPHLGSSRFPDSGNVRVNILVAKRGAYGLNIFSQARPYAHQSLCLHERFLSFVYACLLGAMMCFMDTPVRTLS